MSPDDFLDNELSILLEKTGVTLPDCDCYCGTPIMPKWFREILSVKFNKSCKIHDVHYIAFDIDNEDADQLFLEHMYLQAGKSLYWKCVAFFMFFNVRVFQFFAKDFVLSFKD